MPTRRKCPKAVNVGGAPRLCMLDAAHLGPCETQASGSVSRKCPKAVNVGGTPRLCMLDAAHHGPCQTQA